MNEFRCKKCDRLLGKVDGDAEIVCVRCGGINTYHRKSGEVTYISRLRKQSERQVISGKRFD